jgi:hypothetical protein
MYRSVFASLCVVSVAQEASELGHLGTKCRESVTGLGQRGLNDQEVAAFCRAAYSPDLCSSMRSALGSQPWSEDRIAAACQGWQDRMMPKLLSMTPERRAMSLSDLQDTLDQCAEQKSQIGYELPRNSDGSVDMERTAYLKYQQTQQVQAAYNACMYGGDTELAKEATERATMASSVDGPPHAEGSTVSTITVPVVDIPRLYAARVGALATHSAVAFAAAGLGFLSLLALAVVNGHLGRSPEVTEALLEELQVLEE